MDERKPLTKEQRRQRQKRLDQIRNQRERRLTTATTAGSDEEVEIREEEERRKRVGRPKRRDVTKSDIRGLKYFNKLAPLLERLHDDGCERDQARKRGLHYNQYCMLILLRLFCPLVTSL